MAAEPASALVRRGLPPRERGKAVQVSRTVSSGRDINTQPRVLTISSADRPLNFHWGLSSAALHSSPHCLDTQAAFDPVHTHWESALDKGKPANKGRPDGQVGESEERQTGGEIWRRWRRTGHREALGAGKRDGCLRPSSFSPFVFAVLHRGRKCWISLGRDKIAVKAIWVTSPITLLSRAGVWQAGRPPRGRLALPLSICIIYTGFLLESAIPLRLSFSPPLQQTLHERTPRFSL